MMMVMIYLFISLLEEGLSASYPRLFQGSCAEGSCGEMLLFQGEK